MTVPQNERYRWVQDCIYSVRCYQTTPRISNVFLVEFAWGYRIYKELANQRNTQGR